MSFLSVSPVLSTGCSCGGGLGEEAGWLAVRQAGWIIVRLDD